MYLQRWSAPPGEDTHQYSYLPGTTVILTPFWGLFGDVRYGCIAALGVASLLASRLQAVRPAAVAGCLMALVPLTTYGIQMSWTEPILLVAITGMIFLVTRGRPNWAAVCFAAALVTKQYAWVMIPFAASWKAFGWRRTVAGSVGALVFMLPWVLSAWHAFIQGAILGNMQDGGGAWGQCGLLALFHALGRGSHDTAWERSTSCDNGRGYGPSGRSPLAASSPEFVRLHARDSDHPCRFRSVQPAQLLQPMVACDVSRDCRDPCALPEGDNDHVVLPEAVETVESDPVLPTGETVTDVQAGALRPPLKAVLD